MQRTADRLTTSAKTSSGASILNPGTWLRGLSSMLWGDRFTIDAPPAKPQKQLREMPYVRYRARRRSLPNTFTRLDWERAQEYWNYACAVCGRQRGLWHTISQDHWVPLTDPTCPGTVATNMLPLCCGENGCNNSKGKKNPELWLIEKLGKRKAKKKVAEINAYFGWVTDLKIQLEYDSRVECPDCGYGLLFDEITHLWHCDCCHSDWRERRD